MKFFLSILRTIGGVLYASMFGCALLWIFLKVTPIVLNLSISDIILLVVAMAVVSSVLVFLHSIIMFPQLYLVKGNKVASILSVIPLGITCIISVCLPFLGNNYSVWQWILAILLSIYALSIYVSYGFATIMTGFEE